MTVVRQKRRDDSVYALPPGGFGHTWIVTQSNGKRAALPFGPCIDPITERYRNVASPDGRQSCRCPAAGRNLRHPLFGETVSNGSVFRGQRAATATTRTTPAREWSSKLSPVTRLQATGEP